MVKSCCVVAMPRTGSELLMHYYRYVRKFAYGGEFLAYDVGNPSVVIPGDSSVFFERYKIANHSHDHSIEHEFFRRLSGIDEYSNSFSRPVVVKTFSSIFKTHPTVFRAIEQHLDIVFVARRDILKSVASAMICSANSIWHGNPSRMQQAHDEAQSCTVNLSEAKQYFDDHVVHAQLLTKSRKVGRAVVFYEDFACEPYQQLNRLLGGHDDVTTVPRLSSFIRDRHENLITNFNEVQELYDSQYKRVFDELYGW